jgi:hypothetical protein
MEMTFNDSQLALQAAINEWRESRGHSTTTASGTATLWWVPKDDIESFDDRDFPDGLLTDDEAGDWEAGERMIFSFLENTGSTYGTRCILICALWTLFALLLRCGYKPLAFMEQAYS